MADINLVKRSELSVNLTPTQLDQNWTDIEDSIIKGDSLYMTQAVACSDLTTDLTTGTSKGYVAFPFAITVTAVYASVLTAPVGSTIIVDINDGGTTIFSTKLTIDASEKTSGTAATAAVISDTAIAANAEVTFDIDQIGSSTAGKGLIVWLIFKKNT